MTRVVDWCRLFLGMLAGEMASLGRRAQEWREVKIQMQKRDVRYAVMTVMAIA